MPPEFQPSSDDLARYLEQRGELTKPWNLQMLRLKKLNIIIKQFIHIYLRFVGPFHASMPPSKFIAAYPF